MKVLVTGGCGLIGYNAAKYYAEKGHQVEVMDNLERSMLLGHRVSDVRTNYNRNLLEKMGIKVHLLDVSKEDSFRWFYGHDLIIHLAGQCGVPTSIENPRRDYEVNLQGTFNVLEYARQHDSTVVFSSTNKVYPLTNKEFWFDETAKRWRFKFESWHRNGFPVKNDLIGSRTPYGWSKYSADLLCQEYYHTYGVRTGIFRMSCIYGPNQFGFEEQGWATWFVIAAQKGLPLTIYGDGNQVRDMLYVEDCVKAYDTFVQSDVEHGLFNLGGGVNNTLSLNETIKFLNNMYSKELKVSYADWRPCDQKAYISDILPIRSLGWEPTVSPEEGLLKVKEWVTPIVDIF